MKESQIEQSQRFIAQNKELLAQHLAIAWQHASEFLKHEPPVELPKEVLETLNSYMAAKNLSAFQLTFRQHAVAFSQAHGSTRYWALNDGMSALTDALGTYWPYMTEARRMQYLSDSTLFFADLTHIEAELA